MIKIVDGNLLESDVDIICHQTNCHGVMGAGIAKQIKNKYPEVFETYSTLCKNKHSEQLLGYIQLVETDTSKTKFVCNMFGQNDFGSFKVQTDYPALKKCFDRLANYVKDKGLKVGIPYKFGCGLAGGNWDIVYKIIEDAFKNIPKTKVYIYKFEQ